MALEWNGQKVTRDVDRACREGVDATMAACVIHAKRNHPWRNRTGIAERSIQIAQHAREEGPRVRGVWGSLNVAYFRFLEFGTSRSRPYPSLRPAADAEYGSLATRINRLLRR